MILSGAREPLRLEGCAAEAPARRLGLSDAKVVEAVVAYFGPGTQFRRLDESLVAGGQMSPKAPVRVLSPQGEQRVLIRELPFYIDAPRQFGEFSTRFQSWLSERGLTPRLLPLLGDARGGYLASLGGDSGAPGFVYAQRFLGNARSLASMDRPEAGLYGATLRRFHDTAREYPPLREGSIPAQFQRHSGVLQDEIFGFVEDAFAQTHPEPAHQQEFHRLVEAFKDHKASFSFSPSPAGTRLTTLVHGDFNPGNVLLDGERAQLIDFDNLGVGHPASDIAQALCAMTVFRFFDGSVRARVLPTELSPLAQRAATEFLEGYFKPGATSAKQNELHDRLKIEIPLALEKDVLLGFLNGKFPLSQLPTARARVSALEASFDSWLKQARHPVAARPASTSPAPVERTQEQFLAGLFNGWRPGVATLTRDYWLEHLDPEHQRDHEALLTEWRATEPARDYISWLADHRSNGGRTPEDVNTAYLLGTEAHRQSAVTFERGRDGQTRIRPVGTGDARWLALVEQSAEPVDLLIVSHPNFDMFADVKGPTADGSVFHSSHPNGGPVGMAGFVPVAPDRTVGTIRGESGHYKGGPRQIYELADNLVRNNLVDPAQMTFQAFGEPVRTGAELLSGPVPATPSRPPEVLFDWFAAPKRD